MNLMILIQIDKNSSRASSGARTLKIRQHQGYRARHSSWRTEDNPSLSGSSGGNTQSWQLQLLQRTPCYRVGQTRKGLSYFVSLQGDCSFQWVFQVACNLISPAFDISIITFDPDPKYHIFLACSRALQLHSLVQGTVSVVAQSFCVNNLPFPNLAHRTNFIYGRRPLFHQCLGGSRYGLAGTIELYQISKIFPDERSEREAVNLLDV